MPLPPRYSVLLSFSLVTLTNSWLWITFSPLESSLSSSLWFVSSESINQLSTVFMFSYVLLGIPFIYLLSICNLRKGLLAGAVLTFIGSLIRYLFATQSGVKGFAFAYVGSFVASVGQLFTLAVPPMLATSWFPKEERSLATGIGVLANQSGTALGLGITGLLVTDVNSDLKTYLGIQTLSAFVGCVLVYIFVSDSPENAPSQAAKQRQANNNNSNNEIPSSSSSASASPNPNPSSSFSNFKTYTSQIRSMLSTPSVLLLTLSYGLSTGVFYTLATFLSQLLPDWSSSNSSSLGLTIVIVGLLGSLTSGIWLDSSRQYLQVSRFFYLTSFISMILWTLVLTLNSSGE
ncbi:hypothetical protein TL16_g06120 [Triparma laevis f. inornata]|uniref:Major facilitator superfamily (MFS) profile domain-containing protein n=1 Tax=Triparma laevis f. inornata TaxID=1714386 RepID=A0A9W7E9F2_9STRA|nr:hypothetical protein TL16_g06120 [Triparma laevis f. inornata]